MSIRHLLASITLLVSLLVSWTASAQSPSGWPRDRQKNYTEDCLKTMGQEFGTTSPKKVCQCMLEKSMRQYPDPDQIDREFEDPAEEQRQMAAYAREIIFPCLNEAHADHWLPEMEKQFREACRTNAKEYLNEANTDKYCTCMEERMKKAYPGAGDFANLSIANMDQEIADLAEGCLKELDLGVKED